MYITYIHNIVITILYMYINAESYFIRRICYYCCVVSCNCCFWWCLAYTTHTPTLAHMAASMGISCVVGAEWAGRCALCILTPFSVCSVPNERLLVRVCMQMMSYYVYSVASHTAHNTQPYEYIILLLWYDMMYATLT